MQKIRLLLVDDHRLVAESWTLLLNADPRFEVIGFVTESEQAFDIIRHHSPDIVLTDIAMTPVDGINLTHLIHQHSLSCKVIGVSLHSSPGYAKKIMAAGAMGYISKNSSKNELCKAIEEVYNGKKYVCDEVKTKLAEEKLMDSRFDTLTSKELLIMKLLKEGLTSKEIALEQDMSRKTVEVHRYNILKKLGLPNIAALINLMYERGM